MRHIRIHNGELGSTVRRIQGFRPAIGIAAILVFLAALAGGQTITNLVDNGGPVMQMRTAFVIFWLPPGFHYDSTNTAAADTTYEMLMSRFFTDVSGSTYINILSQYPGVCAPPATSANSPCLGPISVVTLPIETRAYATGAGTAINPLRDSDIQTEISNAISARGLTPDLSMGFFVFLGAGVVECIRIGTCSGGNFPFFCAYHSSFAVAGGTAAYAVMPNVDSAGPGCDESVATAPNQVAADRETVTLSHEFAEMITDPLNSNNAWLAIDGSEVADLCQSPYFSDSQLGTLSANGSNAVFNGHSLVLQELWSNDDESCLVSFINNYAGPTVETNFFTGNHNLPGGNAVTGNLQAQDGTNYNGQVKYQSQPGFDSGTFHVRVFPNSLTSPLRQEQFTMNGGGTWDIAALDLKLRNPDGSIICEEFQAGNPLISLTSSTPATFPTPNCLPPPPPQENVVCNVFDDGDTNQQGPTDAIFFSGRKNNSLDERGKACMPGGQFGICHKWFGGCQTVTTHVSVKFSIFNDGGGNPVGPSDAIYIPKDGNQACVPDGTSTGTCRRWFGMGKADDGRNVSCIVFDDGYTNPSFTSGAVYVPKPIPSGGEACIPDNTSTGLCRRWWGRCVAQ